MAIAWKVHKIYGKVNKNKPLLAKICTHVCLSVPVCMLYFLNILLN